MSLFPKKVEYPFNSRHFSEPLMVNRVDMLVHQLETKPDQQKPDFPKLEIQASLFSRSLP